MEDVYGSTPQSPPVEPLHPTLAMSAGWETFKRLVGVSIGVTVVLGLIEGVAGAIPFVSVLFSLLVSPALYAGYFAFCRLAARGGNPPFETLFSGFKRWGSAVGVVLLTGLAVFGMLVPGFLALFALGMAGGFSNSGSGAAVAALVVAIPLFFVGFCFAVWWSVRIQFALWFVMEDDAPGATEAMRRSWALTRGSVWRMLGLGGLCGLVELLGFLALCVGLLAAIPVIVLAVAHAYDQLRARAGLVTAAAPPVPAAETPPPVL